MAKIRLLIPFCLAGAALSGLVLLAAQSSARGWTGQTQQPFPFWTHLSTTTNDLPIPTNSIQQVSSLVLDINKDGLNDFVIGARFGDGPSMVWFERSAAGWERHIIDDEPLDIEAGGAFYDIDQDGDLDLVMGANTSNQVWWWENPYPNYLTGTNWTRRLIKNSGFKRQHDQIFGDFDDDGQEELIFWNQKAKILYMADIPADPHNAGAWPLTAIYSWTTAIEHEGLAAGDIDQDGLVDLIGGGRWFKFNGTGFDPHLIDISQENAKVAAGQLIPGGAPEVVMTTGDGAGYLKWYELVEGNWAAHELLGTNVLVYAAHSLEIGDIDWDGSLDIFAAQVRSANGDPTTKMWVFYGDGAGNFTTEVLQTGYGNHESRLADLDGDCDLDILGKPFDWETPRLDIWINETPCKASLDDWQREVIDGSKPWESAFVIAADINADSFADIISGGWWYENPGEAGGSWTRHTIGEPLNNAALVEDFDGDGKLDILGSQGQGAAANPNLAWGRNDGTGNFTVTTNIEAGDGTILRGAAAVPAPNGSGLEVTLSWQESSYGVQMLTVPADAINALWTWREINALSQHEDLSAGDIDRDSDMDLLLGTKWLRNEAPPGTFPSGPWTALTLFATADEPERSQLADLNRDGRLDAVVTFLSSIPPGKIAWYEQPANPSNPWPEHLIDTTAGLSGLDTADMDNDGDLDIVAGETTVPEPGLPHLTIYENSAGNGSSWSKHTVSSGDEHQNGAQVFDVDNNGILDIFSIGQTHSQVLLYENTGAQIGYTPAAISATQVISLSLGWNLISSFVDPNDPGLDILLGGVKSDMVLMKNGLGEVYWPGLMINTIGAWKEVDGYQIYLTNTVPLTISGTLAIPMRTPITLSPGNNIISFVSQTAQPIDQALTGIASSLVLAKNGRGEIYWPAFGINQIGAMQPGEGYHLYLAEEAVLVYPGGF